KYSHAHNDYLELLASLGGTPTTLEFEDKVGVFEGAAYVTKGLYRPYQNCLMRSDVPFCPVCTREINKMLDFYCK
ncbi:MAG: M64 family metallopeptidase, partial [Bacteroidales bacterium]|nr:M64 family metallopeptidase [Bacteroidales bacterium]